LFRAIFRERKLFLPHSSEWHVPKKRFCYFFIAFPPFPTVVLQKEQKCLHTVHSAGKLERNPGQSWIEFTPASIKQLLNRKGQPIIVDREKEERENIQSSPSLLAGPESIINAKKGMVL
jgi:hypothetical protein